MANQRYGSVRGKVSKVIGTINGEPAYGHSISPKEFVKSDEEEKPMLHRMTKEIIEIPKLKQLKNKKYKKWEEIQSSGPNIREEDLVE
jgi:hypothetical protein